MYVMATWILSLIRLESVLIIYYQLWGVELLTYFHSDLGQLAWINRLNWRNKMEFTNAPRTTTWVNNTMEGYLKKGGGLWFYWLNVAGHSVSIMLMIYTFLTEVK